jgi:hypothetical protein
MQLKQLKAAQQHIVSQAFSSFIRSGALVASGTAAGTFYVFQRGTHFACRYSNGYLFVIVKG